MPSVFENDQDEAQQPADESMEMEEQDEGAEAGEADGAEIDGESNPAYRAATELMLAKLYEDGAAQGIAEALKAAPSVTQGIVDQSMMLADAMEQATEGSVPDELVMSFVIDIVQEVVDIAQAAGVKVGPRDIADSVREVLAQVIETLGGDSTSIRQEMSQLNPDEVGAAAMQFGGQ